MATYEDVPPLGSDEEVEEASLYGDLSASDEALTELGRLRLRRLGDENFKQFFIRLRRVLDQWLASADCEKTDAAALYDLFLKEQLVSIMGGELRTFE